MYCLMETLRERKEIRRFRISRESAIVNRRVKTTMTTAFRVQHERQAEISQPQTHIGQIDGLHHSPRVVFDHELRALPRNPSNFQAYVCIRMTRLLKRETKTRNQNKTA